MCSCSIVITIVDPKVSGSSPECQYSMRLDRLHRVLPNFNPFGVVHWVPEQLNIKAVTGVCKAIDGCSLELCSATPAVALSGICDRIKSIQLHDSIEMALPWDSISYIILHHM